jgi:hypothetical protein
MRLYLRGPRMLGGLVRLGIGLGPEDFRTAVRQRSSNDPLSGGGFVYVVSGVPGKVKIGQTSDPKARLASLQTGSAYPLEFAYIAVLPQTGHIITELKVHELLDRHRGVGEWFDVAPEMAVAAINAVTHKLGIPCQPLTPAMAFEAARVAASAPDQTPSKPDRTFRNIFIGSAMFGIALWIFLMATIQTSPYR